MDSDTIIEKRIHTVLRHLNEYQKRIYLASEAKSIGWGGLSTIERISKI